VSGEEWPREEGVQSNEGSEEICRRGGCDSTSGVLKYIKKLLTPCYPRRKYMKS